MSALKILARLEDVRQAYEELDDALNEEFPVGCYVEIKFGRGITTAKIVDKAEKGNIFCQNLRTGTLRRVFVREWRMPQVVIWPEERVQP